MSAHTPGPWFVDHRGVVCWTNPGGNSTNVAYVDESDRASWRWQENGDASANARLVAAAPELLLLLEIVAARLRNDEFRKVSTPAWEAMRLDIEELIAKAKDGR